MNDSSSYITFISILALLGVSSSVPDDFRALFNSEDPSGWVNVIGAPRTWIIKGQSIKVTGTPKCILRTERQYENYIFEMDYKAQDPSEAAGIIVHSDALPATGQPWPRGLSIRLGGDSEGPAITPLAGAMIEPVRSGRDRAKGRSGQLGSLSNDEWNHCRIESRDGHITLKINGRVVSTANYASPRKGYIALKSNGSAVQFKNIRIKELPSTNPAPYEVAAIDRGFVSLYNGLNLSENWEMKPGHREHWTARNWIINYDGKSEEKDKSLWTK